MLLPAQHQLPWRLAIYSAAFAPYFAGFTPVGSLRSYSPGSENPRVGGWIPPLATFTINVLASGQVHLSGVIRSGFLLI